MRVRIGLRSGGLRVSVTAAAITAAAMGLLGCGQPPPDSGGGAAATASARSMSNSVKPTARLEMAALGPDERRVALLVIPGDALVEVDGQPVNRRDGAIDLTGKVGDVRRVRVWKGARTTDEKSVTIQETQPSPALVDLNEAPPLKPAGKGPKKPSRFGGFDD